MLGPSDAASWRELPQGFHDVSPKNSRRRPRQLPASFLLVRPLIARNSSTDQGGSGGRIAFQIDVVDQDQIVEDWNFYKLGAGSRPREPGPDLVPRTPQPRRSWGRHYLRINYGRSRQPIVIANSF
jgi:hypothetical protein